jgi:2,4-dienoyl-CoA reductase-like NADH-dependent reductase (Old Yellow Enzyme family)
MSSLFEPGQIGSMTIKNRLVRSPTGDGGMATLQGQCTERMINLYRELAEGGVGLIITGGAFVQEHGRFPDSIALFSDEAIEGYTELTREVHAGGAKIAAQLIHSGRAIPKFENAADGPIAPSAIKVESTGLTPREMTESDIQKMISAFAQSARRAREAGFDAIEFHGCHGDLLHSFLSPLTNHRKDKWGGSLENNMRFILAIYEKTREFVGDDYPIMIKVNAMDYIQGGITLDLSKRIAEKISSAGFDAIEISAGTHTERLFNIARGDIPADVIPPGTDKKNSPLAKWYLGMKDEVKFKEAYLRPFAGAIKKVIGIPLILPGGLRTVAVMEDVLEKGDADFIGLCRPLIRDPYFPNRIKRGLKRSDCLNCNRCLTGYSAIANHNLIQCYQKYCRPPHL